MVFSSRLNRKKARAPFSGCVRVASFLPVATSYNRIELSYSAVARILPSGLSVGQVIDPNRSLFFDFHFPVNVSSSFPVRASQSLAAPSVPHESSFLPSEVNSRFRMYLGSAWKLRCSFGCPRGDSGAG